MSSREALARLLQQENIADALHPQLVVRVPGERQLDNAVAYAGNPPAEASDVVYPRQAADRPVGRTYRTHWR